MGLFQKLFSRGAAKRPRAPEAAAVSADGLSREARVRYWSYWLWRWSHAAGGADAVFEPRLVEQMRGIDPDIEALLPEILARLAALQQCEPADLASAFRRRTGLKAA